jgi:ABC-type glycerol-3-phosphate transport system substrate-binding protein
MTAIRPVRWLALVALCALLAVACGSDGGDQAADEPAGDGSGGSDAAGDGEPVELEIWAQETWMMPPDEFAGFMEEHPNITVKVDFKPEADQLQQMQARKAAGQKLPDLVQDDTFMLEAHMNAENVVPLDEWKDRWEEEEPDTFAELMPTAWDENVIDGDTMSLTLLANMEGLFYNVAWFEEAGVDPAEIDSLDALLDAMRQLKETRPDGIPLSLTAMPSEGVTSQKAFMVAVGAEFEGAVPDLSSEGALYVIDWFKTASAEELLPESAVAWSGGEAQGAFLGDQAAMIIDGIHASGDFAAEPGFEHGTDWSMFPIPTSRSGDQQDGNTANAPWTWFMTPDAEHPYEASLALRYINSQLVEMALAGSGTFRNTEALKDPRLTEAWPFWDESFLESYLDSVPTPAGLNGGEVEGVLEELFAEVITGTDLSAQELADKYQPMLDEL